jgi:hypothetical protein
MPHERRKIRDAVVAFLKNGIPLIGSSPTQYLKLDVGGRVYASRPEPIFPTEYPCALVYFVNEPVREINASRDTIDRTMAVNVDLCHLLRADLDDELDRLAWQAEIILLADHTLGLDFVNHISLSNTVPYQQNIEGEQYRGVTRLTFEADYWTERYTPGTVDEFLNFGKEITAQIGDGATTEFNQTIREA